MLAELNFLLSGGTVDPSVVYDLIVEQQKKAALPKDVCDALEARISLQLDVTQMQDSLAEDGSQNVPASPRQLSAAPVPSSQTAPSGEQTTGVLLNGRYLLEEQIGQSDLSVVYRAIDQRKVEKKALQPQVAIKILNIPSNAQAKDFAVLKQEIEQSWLLSHPNIVKVYDIERQNETVFFSMEFLSGVSLADKIQALKHSAMAPVRALALLKQIGDGLAHAHLQGVVHGDLKPGNVMVTEQDQVKIIDFGIAQILEQADDTTTLLATDSDGDLTVFDARQSRVITASYASPQILQKLAPEPKDDIYSFACMAYELFTGVHPFQKARSIDAMAIGARPKRPRVLSHRQWRALSRGLSFDSSTRFDSVAEFLAELLPAARLGRPPGRVLVLLTGLIIAVIGGWQFVSQMTTDESAVSSAVSESSAYPEAGVQFRDCDDCPVMVVVHPRSKRPGDQPLDPIALSESNVTLAQFRSYVESSRPALDGCRLVGRGWPESKHLRWDDPSLMQKEVDPVMCLSRSDALGYSNWLSAETGNLYHLPSSQESASLGADAASGFTVARGLP